MGKVFCIVDFVVEEVIVVLEFVKKMNGFELCEGDLVRFEVCVIGIF